MIKLEDKSNVNAPSVSFPYGSLRNNPGDNTGTPVNVNLVGDVMQLMEKIMAESGITPNGLPDNEANGWQLYEALLLLTGGGIRREIINIGDWDMDADGIVTVAHGLADYSKIKRVSVMIIPDAGSIILPLDCFDGVSMSGGINQIDGTNIVLSRLASGLFDSTSFDSTSFNRGYILIDYLP